MVIVQVKNFGAGSNSPGDELSYFVEPVYFQIGFTLIERVCFELKIIFGF